MGLAAIEALLAARLGFSTQAVGGPAVENSIRKAMADSSVHDVVAYSRLIHHDQIAWETLVDRIVVPETLFFRDTVPFELVPEIAYARRQQQPGRPLRVLSCPCSTGEEPYSLVFALLDGGAPSDSFTVRAVDVSGRAVRATREARFSANSFRGADLSYRDRFFESVGDGVWRVQKALMPLVAVEQGNVLAPDFLKDEPPFDVVFCRNLLIYLHAQAKASVMTLLRRLVTPDGVLVVGHAEAAIAREHGFSAIGRAGAFAFTPGGPGRVATPPLLPRRVPTAPIVATPRTDTRPPVAPGAPAPSVAGAGLDTEALLERANELADAGDLVEALALCSAHLERCQDSADGHFLMGVLRDAMGDRRLAALSLKKALYLDPSHLAALQHLALEREAAGDLPGAALLRARARRANELSGGGE